MQIDASILVAVIGIIGSVLAYIFGMKRQKVDTQSMELENVQKIIAIYRDTSEIQAKQISELRLEVSALKQEIVVIKMKQSELCLECPYRIKLIDYHNHQTP